jgi:hypothetical protein
VVGRLGRQDVWRWADLEAWARSTGRLTTNNIEARQTVRAWLPGGGRLQRVVDEVIPWGWRLQGVVHVRIWEPTDSQEEPAVVLLGNLEDNQGQSVTNAIEEVAILVGARFLGGGALTAQFYEYWPSDAEGRAVFHHVTFVVRRSGWRRASPEARAIGGELFDPSWRVTTRDEIERLVGEPIEVYTPGSYTAELLAAVRNAGGNVVSAVWDPEGAREAAAAFWLLGGNRASSGRSSVPLPWGLTNEAINVTCAALARRSVGAREEAAKYLSWQDPDAPVCLTLPVLDGVELLREVAADADGVLRDHRALWAALGEVRRVLSGADPDERLQLVPACQSGLSRLAWWEAGVDEPEPPKGGLFGPVARLGEGDDPAPLTDALGAMRTAERCLAKLLSDECAQYPDWDTPRYRPAGPLSSAGATARRYLEQVSWGGISEEDSNRQTRLERVAERGEGEAAGSALCGYDRAGRLVLMAHDRKRFWVEWPTADASRPTSEDAVVRADPRRRQGPAPVFLELADGTLALLPSSRGWAPGHDYTWGYHGTGPANLAAAIVEAAASAARRRLSDLERSMLASAASKRVVSGRTPDWPLAELLREVAPAGERDADA